MSQLQNPCRVKSLDHLVLTVQNISATLGFYTKVLGMQDQIFAASDGTQRRSLTFGEQKINLHQAGHEFEPKAKLPTPGSADLCFLTDTPLKDWLAHLKRHEVAVEEGPISRTGAVGPILSIYVRDPDANLIEISTADF
jgi:catechol 2,3-dioxygenase-like lactoylglutathione lyase family enzyme